MEKLFSDAASFDFLGLSLRDYLILVGIWTAGLIAGKIAGVLVTRFSHRLDAKAREASAIFLRVLAGNTAYFGLALAVRISLGLFEFHPKGVEKTSELVGGILMVLVLTKVLFDLVAVPESVLRRQADAEKSRIDHMLVPLITRSLRGIVVLVGILLIFQEASGQSISTILAGLGIAGIAFGLAAQESIANIFGSIFLFANKPFEIGERIVIEGHDGVVMEMGLSSTRLQRLDGHMVSIPNGQLYKMTIHNIGKRPFIRRVLNVTVTYDTPPEKIEEAVTILRRLLAVDPEDEETRRNEAINQGDLLPRVYFNELNADSLNLICIYWYQPPAYWDFLEHSQWLNLRLMRAFNDAGIDFAFPSQTVYLAGDPRRPLNLPEPTPS